jgi:hypothetical protein
MYLTQTYKTLFLLPSKDLASYYTEKIEAIKAALVTTSTYSIPVPILSSCHAQRPTIGSPSCYTKNIAPVVLPSSF